MSDTDETETPEHSDSEENQDLNEDEKLSSGDSNSAELTPVSGDVSEMPGDGSSKRVLDANHPLMIKYQQNLKERLIKLLTETDEQLNDLKRTIHGQELENDHFAKQGYEFQKQLCIQEEKLNKFQEKYDEVCKKKQGLVENSKVAKQSLEKVEEKLQVERKKDIEYQKKLEDVAFEVVQLSSLQGETFTDAKSLQRAVEKSNKDRENLELQKLRQESIYKIHSRSGFYIKSMRYSGWK